MREQYRLEVACHLALSAPCKWRSSLWATQGSLLHHACIQATHLAPAAGMRCNQTPAAQGCWLHKLLWCIEHWGKPSWLPSSALGHEGAPAPVSERTGPAKGFLLVILLKLGCEAGALLVLAILCRRRWFKHAAMQRQPPWQQRHQPCRKHLRSLDGHLANETVRLGLHVQPQRRWRGLLGHKAVALILTQASLADMDGIST